MLSALVEDGSRRRGSPGRQVIAIAEMIHLEGRNKSCDALPGHRCLQLAGWEELRQGRDEAARDVVLCGACAIEGLIIQIM